MYFSFTKKEKKEIAEDIIDYLESHEGINLESNETYTICNSLCIKLGISKDFKKYHNI